MGTLDLARIRKLLAAGKILGSVAIETGTCRGHGAKHLAGEFPRVITMELSRDLCEAAKARWSKDFPQIEFLQGHSADLLKKILPELSPFESIFFFLDAHWSGDASVNWKDSKWKGYGLDTAHRGAPGSLPTPQEQCPLPEELQAIMEYCRGEAFIVIDDTKNIPASGPGSKNVAFQGEDWSHINRELLLSIVNPRLEEFVELDKPGQWFLRLKPSPRRP